ncbi:helix-turn-helix domain-containing protein [Brachybacterium sp. UNK5269]|uniref:helix-turn-helix domain-containing protein n=1 Tax=Brachybacterium sp. UNK5269 TaxID=3408576 RepID=UPI003BB01C48
MLNLAQVADLLATSKPTVRRLIDTQSLRAVKLGRQWRVARDDLRTYLLTPSDLEDIDAAEDTETD